MIKLLDILNEMRINKPGDPDLQKVYDYIKNGSKGDLDLSGTNIKRLPNSLKKVGGDLYLSFSQIISLPDNLSVGGGLDLGNTLIVSLPDNLHVRDYLSLDNCKNLTSLPDNLNVGGGLYLYNTPITSLPPDLKVEDNLYLDDTPLSQTHTREQIKQMAPGIKGEIYM